MKAYLVLENGMLFEGERFGAGGEVTGELVFTTGMTGYLETLTDPSFYGQIIVQTFPLIGNYGVIPPDFESSTQGACAYIAKYPCMEPSNFRSEGSLDGFLSERGIIGLCGIDTRALTRLIRENGVMNGRISGHRPCDSDIEALRSYQLRNPVLKVSAQAIKLYRADAPKYAVALFDFGAKENIRRALLARGCDVWVFPSESTAEEILAVHPDGIVLSNGPGDPTDNPGAIRCIKTLFKAGVPMLGICLGHQLMALASGFQTSKLKYGHRGANQPVRDIHSGRVFITSQNHGYTVTNESIDPRTAEAWFINVNDGTCEGIQYKNAPARSVQFHPEACPGPEDTAFLFDRFTQSLEVRKNAVE